MIDDETRPLTDKQRRVLDAALGVFAEKGFAAASTAEIAKKAGVAEATIFKHYRTKKDLLIGLVAPMFFRFVAPTLLAEVHAIFDEDYDDVAVLIRRLYANRLAFIRQHERALRVAIQELPFHEEVRALAKQTIVTHLWPRARAAFLRLQAKGAVREGDPATMMRIAALTFANYAVLRIVVAPERDWDDEQEIALMVDIIAQGLRPPPGAARA